MAHRPLGLGETMAPPTWLGRLSLDLAPGSTPPSCVTLGQWRDLSESCVRGRSQSPGHPLGPPWRVSVRAARWALGFLQQRGFTPRGSVMAQGRNSEPSCRGRQTRRRPQGPGTRGRVLQAEVPRGDLVP